jgi:two-component system LytT family sensor kinase
MKRAGVSRAQAFWLLQVAGWTGYALVKGLAFPLAATDAAWVIGKGIAMTAALAVVLRGLERRPWPPALQVGVAGGLAIATALVSLQLSLRAAQAGWVFAAPGAVDWLASMEGRLYESLLYLAWTALYLGIRRGLDLRQERARLGLALQRAQHARALMLRYQLNPHFLFNALASLRALVREDADRAERVITDLSAFLRHCLADTGDGDSTLAREFDAVDRYLAIQKVRFEARIDYRVAHDPALADVRLPSFLLQPLVENAVKYGMHTCRSGPTRVDVTARREAGRCVLEIRNSGRWVDEDQACGARLERSGLGLANLRERLAAQNPGRFDFHVGPRGDQVVARLALDLA